MKKVIRTKAGFRVTHMNRRRACRLMCVECMGWENGEVDKCDGKMLDGTVCALVKFRKINSKQNAPARNKAIRNFCLECMGGDTYSISKCTARFCPVFPYRNSNTDKSFLFKDSVKDKTVLDMSAK